MNFLCYIRNFIDKNIIRNDTLKQFYHLQENSEEIKNKIIEICKTELSDSPIGMTMINFMTIFKQLDN